MLSVYVTWENDRLLDELEKKKKEAQTTDQYINGVIEDCESDVSWSYKIGPKGSAGFDYFLLAPDYYLKIARVKKKGSMPDIYVEIRSETLWTLGKEEAVERILAVIRTQTASIDEVKPSRVDLCVDTTMPETEWCQELKKKRVCRATKVHGWEDKEGDEDVIETIQIGKGDLIVRIYDKPKEIKSKSKKYWMYDIWDVGGGLPGFKIIRVEFQAKRSILRTFKINNLNNLYSSLEGLWFYFTQNWLKFLEKPERNKDRQKVHPWWLAVQGGFGQISEPLERIRSTSSKLEQEQIIKRALSCLENLTASDAAATLMPKDADYSLNAACDLFLRKCEQLGHYDMAFSSNVKKKLVDYQRQDNEKPPF